MKRLGPFVWAHVLGVFLALVVVSPLAWIGLRAWEGGAAELRSVFLINCGGIVDLMGRFQDALDEEEGAGAVRGRAERAAGCAGGEARLVEAGAADCGRHRRGVLLRLRRLGRRGLWFRCRLRIGCGLWL